MATLEYQVDSAILIITLNNPDFGNSFGPKEAELLEKAMAFGHKQKFRAVIFQAVPGRIFCSGGNLKYYAKLKTPAEGLRTNKKIGASLKKFASLTVPTLCLVEGDCFGGGMELVSAFDYVIATPQAYFGFWQKRIGLTFGWGGGARLLQRVGPQKLKQLSLETRAISAYQACELGLIDEILTPARIKTLSFPWLKSVLSGPQTPVAKIKAFSEKNEQKNFTSLWMQDDHRKILNQFKK